MLPVPRPPPISAHLEFGPLQSPALGAPRLPRRRGRPRPGRSFPELDNISRAVCFFPRNSGSLNSSAPPSCPSSRMSRNSCGTKVALSHAHPIPHSTTSSRGSGPMSSPVTSLNSLESRRTVRPDPEPVVRFYGVTSLDRRPLHLLLLSLRPSSPCLEGSGCSAMPCHCHMQPVRHRRAHTFSCDHTPGAHPTHPDQGIAAGFGARTRTR